MEEKKEYREYEILPISELEQLKSDIKRLKELVPTPEEHKIASESASSLKSLHDAILDLNELFSKSSRDMVMEDDLIKTLNKKVDQIIDQNEKIAEGIVAVADLLKDMKEQKAAPPRQEQVPMQAQQQQYMMPPPQFMDQQQPMPPPQFGPPPMPPRMGMDTPLGAPLPPPGPMPPPPLRKKKLFGKF